MKTYISWVAAFLLLLKLTNIQAQSYLWAKEGSAYTNGEAITTDDSGNVYVAGIFGDSAYFDNQKVCCIPSVSVGIYIAKFSAAGKTEWLRYISAIAFTATPTIEVNSQGEIYLAGSFNQQLIIGTDTLNSVYSDSTGYNSYFLVKYDRAANVMWHRFGQASTRGLIASVLDIKENIILVVDEDSNPEHILKYDKNGVLITTIKPAAYVSGLAQDFSGNFYITGSFSAASLTLGNYTLQNTSAARKSAAYLAKLDSSFNPLWAKAVDGQGKGVSQGIAITTDKKGSVYMVGNCNDTLSIENLTLTTAGNFVARFDTSGVIKWIKNGSLTFESITSDTSGFNCIIGVYDNFITAFDTTGKFDTIPWNAQNNTNTTLNAISIGKGRTMYLTGTIRTTQSFGLTTFVVAPGSNSQFVAVLQNDSVKAVAKNSISGTVFADLNKNCIKDGNEPALQGYGVTAFPGPYYAVTDVNGNYTLSVDTGTYTVSQLLPVSDTLISNQECPALSGTYLVTIKSEGADVTGFNFADTVSHCPLLRISFSTNYNVNMVGYCPIATYPYNTIINYSNSSSAPAQNVLITLNYPSGFAVSTASLPYTTTSDSIVTFTIGSLQPNSSGSIQILDSVPCSSILFKSYTYKAVITPTNCVAQDTTYNVTTIQKSFNAVDPGAVVPSANSLTGVTLYPNPTKGNFILIFKEADSYQITIYNNLGQQVQTVNINGAEASLSLDNAAQGIYYVNIISSRGSAMKKLAVE